MWNYRHLKASWEKFLSVCVKGAAGSAGRSQDHLDHNPGRRWYRAPIGRIKHQGHPATSHIQARIQLVRGLFVSSQESDCREQRVTSACHSNRCRAGNWTRSSAPRASWRRRRRCVSVSGSRKWLCLLPLVSLVLEPLLM